MEVEEEDCGFSQDNFCFPDNSTNPATTEALNAETIRQDPAPSTSGMVALSSRNFGVNKSAKKRSYFHSKIENCYRKALQHGRRMRLAEKEPDMPEIGSGVSSVAHYEYIFVSKSDKTDIPELQSGVYQILPDEVKKIVGDDDAPKSSPGFHCSATKSIEDRLHDQELLKEGLIKFCQKHGLKAKDSLMKQKKLLCNFSSLLSQPELLEGQVPDEIIALLKNCQIK